MKIEISCYTLCEEHKRGMRKSVLGFNGTNLLLATTAYQKYTLSTMNELL